MGWMLDLINKLYYVNFWPIDYNVTSRYVSQLISTFHEGTLCCLEITHKQDMIDHLVEVWTIKYLPIRGAFTLDDFSKQGLTPRPILKIIYHYPPRKMLPKIHQFFGSKMTPILIRSGGRMLPLTVRNHLLAAVLPPFAQPLLISTAVNSLTLLFKSRDKSQHLESFELLSKSKDKKKGEFSFLIIVNEPCLVDPDNI